VAIKYECYYCKKIFPAEETIDGYDQGYKVGFLCPNCGKNIQAGLMAKQKVSHEQYVWTFIAFILFLPTIFTADSERVVEMLGQEIYLNTFLFVLWVAFMVVLMVLKPSLVFVRTFLTEPTDEG
jgi:DNA-directed RNA polymerase subunit RPC12/RpoP